MAKRYFVSVVVGTGTKLDPYRLKLADELGVALSAIIPTNASGAPRFAWGLGYVSLADFSNLDVDVESAGFPAVDTTTLLSDIPAAVRNKVQNFLTNRGVDLSGITLQNTIADVLDRVSLRIGGDWRGMFVP